MEVLAAPSAGASAPTEPSPTFSDGPSPRYRRDSGDDPAALSPDEDSGDDYYDDDPSESDGELDWDPDRERLLRTLQKTGAAGVHGGGTTSHYSSGSTKSLAERCALPAQTCSLPRVPVGPGHVGSPMLDVARGNMRRRNEWRASRGLERQKTVQEIIAERRAAREASRASALGAVASSSSSLAASAPLRPPSDRPLEPYSADRALDVGSSSETGVQEQAVGGAAEASSSSSTNAVPPEQPSARDAKGRAKKKGGWPWRTR